MSSDRLLVAVIASLVAVAPGRMGVVHAQPAPPAPPAAPTPVPPPSSDPTPAPATPDPVTPPTTPPTGTTPWPSDSHNTVAPPTGTTPWPSDSHNTVAPPPVTPPATPPAAAPANKGPRMPIALYPARGNYVGIEVGMARVADPRNQFGDGPGKTLVLGIRNWEFRVYEQYEQEDRSDPDQFGDAQGVRARFSITSVGRRLIFPTGTKYVAVRALLGGAWVRRDSYRNDPDALLTTTGLAMRPQHGIAAMVGGGVQVGPFTVEMRAYPALWADISDDSRYEIDGTEPSSMMESPGGIPVTLTAGVGFFF